VADVVAEELVEDDVVAVLSELEGLADMGATGTMLGVLDDAGVVLGVVPAEVTGTIDPVGWDVLADAPEVEDDVVVGT